MIEIVKIDLDDLTFQTRIEFDDEYIHRLAEDILINGLRNPIGLQLKNGLYRVVYGFCRIKAFQLLGRTQIPAKKYDELTVKEAHIQNFSDNIRHMDLSPLEVGLKLRFLRDELHFTVDELEVLTEKGEVTVYNLIKLTTLEPEIQMAVHNERIRVSHALEISRFPEFKRLKILKQAVREHLSVNEIKRLRNVARGVRKITLQLPVGIADILKDLPPKSQTKIMNRIMNFGTRPHNPQWYENFGRGDLLDAVRWDKKVSVSGCYGLYYKHFLKPFTVPKYGCEYAITVAAIKHNFVCPNKIEWVVLAPEQTVPSDNPLENRPAWFFWCEECAKEAFPNIRFYKDYYWYPRGSEVEPYQHIVSRHELHKLQMKPIDTVGN